MEPIKQIQAEGSTSSLLLTTNELNPFLNQSQQTSISNEPSKLKSRKLNSNLKSERKVGEMPGPWISFLDNVWEGEDFEESLLALEGMVGSLFLTSISHMRQLLALALSPSSCLPIHQIKPSRQIPNSTREPYSPTTRKLRLQALRLIEDIVNTSGTETLFRSLPSYEPDLSIDLNEDESLLELKRTNSKGKRVADHFDEEEDDEEEGPLYLAGKRVSKCEDLWDFLGGMAEGIEPNRIRNREEPIIQGGWEMLRSLVGVWELEAKTRFSSGSANISPSLLRQLKPTVRGPREVSAKLFDVLFWPFTHSELNDKGENLDGPVDNDEMDVAEKRQVSGRIIALLARLAVAGNLELASFERQVWMASKKWPESIFADFLENFRTSPTIFVIRLCNTYLNLNSHPLAKSLTSTTPSIPINTSPRRKALGATNSNPNFNSSSQLMMNSSQTLSQHTIETLSQSSLPIFNSEFFPLPTVVNILNALSRIPSTVPVDPSTIVAETPIPVIPQAMERRKPKTRISNIPQEVVSDQSEIEKSLRKFELIKETLVGAAFDWDEFSLETGGGKGKLKEGGLTIEKVREALKM